MGVVMNLAMTGMSVGVLAKILMCARVAKCS